MAGALFFRSVCYPDGEPEMIYVKSVLAGILAVLARGFFLPAVLVVVFLVFAGGFY